MGEGSIHEGIHILPQILYIIYLDLHSFLGMDEYGTI